MPNIQRASTPFTLVTLFALSLLTCSLLAPSLVGADEPPSAEAVAQPILLGDGTAASCSETALRSALGVGGTIQLNCGGPVTIPIRALIEVSADTVLDGAGQVTLDGGGATRLFYVNKWEKRNGTVLELRNLTLTGGRSGGSLDPTYGGCIYARRSVTRLVNVNMRGCQASEAGGGLYLYGGSATITGGTFSANVSTYGAAMHAILGGSIVVSDATFQGNRVAGDGGAIYAGDATLEVRNSTFTGNVAEGSTGKPYAGLGGAIYTNNPGAVATITDSVFTGNSASESGGAIFADYDTTTTIAGSFFTDNQSLPLRDGASGNGGAIGTARSTLTLSNSELRGNDAMAGGGLFNGKESRANLTRVLISENVSQGNGGGIYNIGAALTLNESTVAFNSSGTESSSGKQGGGIVIYSGSTVQLLNSTISNNRATGANGSGGGIFVSNAELTIGSSTIAGNSAAHGGGGLLYNSGTTRIVGSTFAENSAASFGAQVGITAGAPSVSNSLLVGGGDKACNKPLNDQGHNLQFPGKSCGASIAVADPLLQPLGDNGGPTRTIALGAGSPAIDAGNSGSCTARDQRGYARQGSCDRGAFEFGSGGPPALGLRTYLPLVRR